MAVSKYFATIEVAYLAWSTEMDQARYATSIVAKYLDTVTVKVSNKFYETTLPSYMIFTKEDVSTSDEQVEKLTREYNIHY